MMQHIPLIGGAYQARSTLASAQRCVNLFPEVNPKDSPAPVTHYQRPGFVPLGQPAAAGLGRAIYQSSNGVGYAVVGSYLYRVESDWKFTQLGGLSGLRSGPCSMTDNGQTLLVVDGSPYGWTVDMTDYSFAQVSDPTGIFTGADRVDNIDGYVLWNISNTRQFGCSLNNEIAFDALFFASKSNYPDPLQTLIVNRHEILMVGLFKSELWYDAGGALFPMAELPGAYIEHGICAKYSIASSDLAVFWLGRDLQGQGVVFMQQGYQCQRISNHALEYQIRQMTVAGADISDATGYTYQIEGHVFYVLSFPSGDQTWVYDMATQQWHQRAWIDANGALHRDRSNCGAALYGKNVVLDWENGTLYELDPNSFYDKVNGIVSFPPYIRSFPNVSSGLDSSAGAMMSYTGKMAVLKRVQADIETGTVDTGLYGDAVPLVSLRVSLDRGKTFGVPVTMPMGKTGEFLTTPDWRTLGQTRNFVIELSWTFPGQAALQGAWIDLAISNQ